MAPVGSRGDRDGVRRDGRYRTWGVPAHHRDHVTVTDTATGQVADLAQPANTALTGLWRLAQAAHAEDREPDQDMIAEPLHLLRSAVILGAEAAAARGNPPEREHHNLFARLCARRADYLWVSPTPAVPSAPTRSSRPSRC